MEKVTKEEFITAMQCFILKPVSSFTDVDGTLPYGLGFPAMDTDYGTEKSDLPIARCEMRKNNSDQKEWDYYYYLDESINLYHTHVLDHYGGDGLYGCREKGHYKVKYGMENNGRVEEFNLLSEANSFYENLNTNKALWSLNMMPELLKSEMFLPKEFIDSEDYPF